MNTIFEIGQQVKCINSKLLPGNDYAPSLIEGREYTIKDITLDKENNQHLDVGLKSDLNYVTSYETKEALPEGNKIHWCHPSRFEII